MAKKVVFDTNVLISSIFWKEGNFHKIVKMEIDKKIIKNPSRSKLRGLSNSKSEFVSLQAQSLEV